jgi:hypothetical protein
MNGIRAAMVARVEALKDLNPKVFGAVLIVGAVLLIASGLDHGKSREDQEAPCPSR